MWVSSKEWKELRGHVKTLNEEMGGVLKDLGWIKYLLGLLLPAVAGGNILALLKLFGVI